MDELRNQVWDYLFRLGEPQQIAVIAEQMDETPSTIQQVVDNPWFEVQDGWVAIAHVDR